MSDLVACNIKACLPPLEESTLDLIATGELSCRWLRACDQNECSDLISNLKIVCYGYETQEYAHSLSLKICRN